jgi:hypothetical protein
VNFLKFPQVVTDKNANVMRTEISTHKLVLSISPAIPITCAAQASGVPLKKIEIQ